MPYPWPNKGRYEVIEYGFEHLKDLDRTIKCVAEIDRSVQFKFSYHCFTDSLKKSGDFRRRFVDPGVPDEDRVFCPKRWLLSLKLADLMRSGIEKKRLVSTAGCQWVLNERIPGMSRPYVIYFKFGIGRPGHPLVINVNSAFVRGDGEVKGQRYRFTAILKKAADGERVCDGSNLEKEFA